MRENENLCNLSYTWKHFVVAFPLSSEEFLLLNVSARSHFHCFSRDFRSKSLKFSQHKFFVIETVQKTLDSFSSKFYCRWTSSRKNSAVISYQRNKKCDKWSRVMKWLILDYFRHRSTPAAWKPTSRHRRMSFCSRALDHVPVRRFYRKRPRRVARFQNRQSATAQWGVIESVSLRFVQQSSHCQKKSPASCRVTLRDQFRVSRQSTFRACKFFVSKRNNLKLFFVIYFTKCLWASWNFYRFSSFPTMQENDEKNYLRDEKTFVRAFS